jgi:hypothetical protein
MLRPGVQRGFLGFIAGIILGALLITVVRLVMGLVPQSGPSVLFGGFGGLFGWLWGVGSFNPHSHEHYGIEHAIEAHEPTSLEKLLHAARAATPGIQEQVKPLIRPMLFALGLCVGVVVLFMVLGLLTTALGVPIARVQTETASASPMTAAGSITLPIGDGLQVNKTVFFVILSVIVLAILGGMAIGLALLMNALSGQVDKAKATPDSPLETEPPAFRLIDFFLSWVNDILEGAKDSISR